MSGRTGSILVGYYETYERDVVDAIQSMDVVTDVEKLGFCTLRVDVDSDVSLQTLKNVDYVHSVEWESRGQVFVGER